MKWVHLILSVLQTGSSYGALVIHNHLIELTDAK